MTAPELRAIAKEMGIGVSGKKKAEVIDEIVASELEGDDEELLDDDEESIEDDSEYITEDQLKEMDIPTLKQTAVDFDIEVKKGMKKSAVIAAILEAQAAPEDSEDDGEEPF